jgi:hypothetical protein
MHADQLFTRLLSPVSGQPPAIWSAAIVHRPRPFPPSTLPLSQPSTDNICSSKKRKFKEQLRNKSFILHRPPSIVRVRSSTFIRSDVQTACPERSEGFKRLQLQSSTFNFQSAIFDPPKT